MLQAKIHLCSYPLLFVFLSVVIIQRCQGDCITGFSQWQLILIRLEYTYTQVVFPFRLQYTQKFSWEICCYRAVHSYLGRAIVNTEQRKDPKSGREIHRFWSFLTRDHPSWLTQVGLWLYLFGAWLFMGPLLLLLSKMSSFGRYIMRSPKSNPVANSVTLSLRLRGKIEPLSGGDKKRGKEVSPECLDSPLPTFPQPAHFGKSVQRVRRG